MSFEFRKQDMKARLKSYLVNKVTRQPPLEKRVVARAKVMGVTTILDVGANQGQFARRLRSYGYRERIVSFEPIGEAFEHLAKSAAQDPLHEIHRFALGDQAATLPINIASNHGASSSLLAFGNVLGADLDITREATENVAVKRLDDVLSDGTVKTDLARTLLKLDTQGFELPALKGAGEALSSIPMVFLEASLVQIYENEPLMFELLGFLDGNGFYVADLEPSVFVEGHVPLQCDIFCLAKSTLSASARL